MILVVILAVPLNTMVTWAEDISADPQSTTQVQTAEVSEEKVDIQDDTKEDKEIINTEEIENEAENTVSEEKKAEDIESESNKEESKETEQSFSEFADNHETVETSEQAEVTETKPSEETVLNEVKNPEGVQTVKTKTTTYVNPIYEDVVSEKDLAPLPENTDSDIETYSNEYGYLDSPEEAVSYLREQMKNRETYIVVNYTTKVQNFGEAARTLSNKALEHTGVANEGDYLKWSYGGWRAEESMGQIGDLYYFTVKYSVTYYTDLGQEQQVSTKVSQVLSSLGLSGQSDYTKVKKFVTIYVQT